MSKEQDNRINFSWKCRDCPLPKECAKNRQKVCPEKVGRAVVKAVDKSSRKNSDSRKRSRKKRSGISGKTVTIGIVGTLAISAFLNRSSEIKAGEFIPNDFFYTYPSQPGQIPQPNISVNDSPSLIESLFAPSDRIAPFFHEVPVGQWEKKLITHAANFPNLNANMGATLMTIESCGNQGAQSPTGAIGLMQLMQSTFPEYTRAQLYDPDTNIFLGLQYLSGLLDTSNGNVQAAFAGYNGGPMALRWIMGNSTRDDYLQFLFTHRSGNWNTYEKANTKVIEVEAMVRLSHIYDDTLDGTRINFDQMQLEGRCVGH